MWSNNWNFSFFSYLFSELCENNPSQQSPSVGDNLADNIIANKDDRNENDVVSYACASGFVSKENHGQTSVDIKCNANKNWELDDASDICIRK